MKKGKTKFVNDREVQRKWHKIDASGKVLGRLATKIATYLRGKHKTIFTPHVDCGDFIVVVNAEKVCVTGKKAKQKTYFTHSGYPGGDKLISFEKKAAMQPEKVVQIAVRGMLPHNRLGERIFRKLKVYRGEPTQFRKMEELEV